MITEEEMGTLAGGEDVTRTAFTFIESITKGYDAERSCEIIDVIFADHENELYKFTYYSNSEHGIDLYEDDTVRRVALKAIKRNEYVEIE